MERGVMGADEHFRVALRYLLKKQGIAAQELAARAGLASSSLYNIKNGKRRGDIRTKELIAEGLGSDYYAMLRLGQELDEAGRPADEPRGWSLTAEERGKLEAVLRVLRGQYSRRATFQLVCSAVDFALDDLHNHEKREGKVVPLHKPKKGEDEP
jgi:transcriptional regulator with XRE-family HTH domain